MPTDWSKSLQELDGQDWGNPAEAETEMVGRARALRRKPLATLSNGEIRLAIGQKIGFPAILELALDRLDADPLLEGDYYPGDLLASLVRLEDADWVGRGELFERLTALFGRAMASTSDDADDFRASLSLPDSAARTN